VVRVRLEPGHFQIDPDKSRRVFGAHVDLGIGVRCP